MKLKNKLVLISVAGLTAVGLLAGGITYALFQNNVSNANNAFTAGSLQISTVRGDVPNVGPMFYTNTTGAPGTLPTGVWAPGDSNTRGLFLENTGSLDAKLKSITAKTADRSGNEVTSGLVYDADIAFANHANLIVWQLNWFDAKNATFPTGPITGGDMDLIMYMVNDGYNLWAAGNPNADPLKNPNASDQAVIAVNKYLLDNINTIRSAASVKGPVYQTATVQVTKMYETPMKGTVNQVLDVSSFKVITPPFGAEMLAFTVSFNLDTGNDMQGASGYFNFNTYWEQSKNN
ncbi:hypothetical protein [Paenibacillus sp. GP183]|uniref:hypothetical protein n=1 Tax=Paenibacillus sp. GP183 TaxID=1882751 RepID=UPI00089D7E7A|nr:hypothetical protein [Paenibacillus sp. GP183]SEB79649.1 hypothetical protein SAMN05443246_1936 [Paenibacillus sp. GP183]